MIIFVLFFSIPHILILFRSLADHNLSLPFYLQDDVTTISPRDLSSRSSAGIAAGIFPSLHLLRHRVALRRPGATCLLLPFPPLRLPLHGVPLPHPQVHPFSLRDFYPLAGKVRLAPGSQSQYELHYAEGDCVPFVVAEHDGDFDDLSGCHPREYTRVRSLAPQIPEPTDDGQRPVMALQVTLFPNKGLALGVSVHHSACDGSSSTRFVSSWACRASGLEEAAPAPPSFDRSSVTDPNDVYSKFFSGFDASAPIVESMMVQFAPPNAVIGTVTLTSDDLGKLKATISSEPKNAFFRCSNIVATYAYAWVSLVKARAPSAESTVHLAFPGNCRGRLQPALPAEYFGNCLNGNFAEAKAGDLAGEDGVAVAARIVGEVIEQFKAEPLRDADKWTEKYHAIAMQRPLTVAGSPGFKVYDVDFGWGKPVKVDMPSIALMGAMSMAESRDESGGVEIGLVAPKTEMDQFVAHFSHGLKLLHKF